MFRQNCIRFILINSLINYLLFIIFKMNLMITKLILQFKKKKHINRLRSSKIKRRNISRDLVDTCSYSRNATTDRTSSPNSDVDTSKHLGNVFSTSHASGKIFARRILGYNVPEASPSMNDEKDKKKGPEELSSG